MCSSLAGSGGSSMLGYSNSSYGSFGYGFGCSGGATNTPAGGGYMRLSWCSHCGNSVIDPGEECDDGNYAAGDGCDTGCYVENLYNCTGQPSVCTIQPFITATLTYATPRTYTVNIPADAMYTRVLSGVAAGGPCGSFGSPPYTAGCTGGGSFANYGGAGGAANGLANYSFAAAAVMYLEVPDSEGYYTAGGNLRILRANDSALAINAGGGGFYFGGSTECNGGDAPNALGGRWTVDAGGAHTAPVAGTHVGSGSYLGGGGGMVTVLSGGCTYPDWSFAGGSAQTPTGTSTSTQMGSGGASVLGFATAGSPGTGYGFGCSAGVSHQRGGAGYAQLAWLTRCTNAHLDFGEECDDGNTVDGDGCNTACIIEPHSWCTGSPSTCAVCGDGVISSAFGEECDDKNQFPGDGCSADCQIESACFNCSGTPSVCTVKPSLGYTFYNTTYAPGTHSVAIPAAHCSLRISGCGGGGAGAWDNQVFPWSGGSGSAAVANLPLVTNATTLYLDVGAGGTAPVSGSFGGNGGNTVVREYTFNGTVLYTVYGGHYGFQGDSISGSGTKAMGGITVRFNNTLSTMSGGGFGQELSALKRHGQRASAYEWGGASAGAVLLLAMGGADTPGLVYESPVTGSYTGSFPTHIAHGGASYYGWGGDSSSTAILLSPGPGGGASGAASGNGAAQAGGNGFLTVSYWAP
jgi:cysteine-rich repeat protein